MSSHWLNARSDQSAARCHRMSSHRGLPVALDKGHCQLGFAGRSSSLAGISHRLRTKAKAEGMEQAKASRDRIACVRWEAQQASAIVRQIPGRHRPLDLECNRANIALIEQSANASPANSGQPPVSSRNTLRHCQHSQAASKDHGPRPQPSAPAPHPMPKRASRAHNEHPQTALVVRHHAKGRSHARGHSARPQPPPTTPGSARTSPKPPPAGRSSPTMGVGAG